MACNDRGTALVIALIAMLLLTALGLMLVLNTAMNMMLAAHFVASQEAFYAADAGIERAMDELEGADWNSVLKGAERSAFAEGSPSGERTLSDGSSINLSEATNLLNCHHPASCTPTEMDASTADRPWGVNNPRWNLYGYGPLSAMVSTGSINSSTYIAVWVSDDQSENDDDPTTDGADDDLSNPGRGVIMVRAEAFGPGGAHRTIEATVGKPGTPPSAGAIRLIGWREIR